MKTLVVVAAVWAGALPGFANAAKECEIVRDTKVTVWDDKYIVVSQDPIVVCATNKWIYWTLDANQPYRFAKDGVVIADDQNEFANCKRGTPGVQELEGRVFKCHDLNNKHGEAKARYYKYTITVERKGSKPISHDPQIMND